MEDRSNLTVIKINDISFTIKKDQLVSEPDSDITVPYNITPNHVLIIRSICNGAEFRNMVHTNTHFTAYISLVLCHKLKLKQCIIDNAFDNYSVDKILKSKNSDKVINIGKFITKQGIEYLYLIYKMHPEAVNWNKFFLEHQSPYISMVGSLQLQEVKNNPELYTEIVKFFDGYDLYNTVENIDATSKSLINVVKNSKRVVADYLLLNPYSDTFAGTVKSTTTDDDVYPCNYYSKYNRVPDGGDVMTSKDNIDLRLNSFMCGLLKTSPNPKMRGRSFPWKNVAISGGSALQIVEKDFNPRKSSDVDLFVYANTYADKCAAVMKLLEWFDSENTYYGVNGSVIYITIVDVPRVFQIICSDAKTMHDIISKFDMSHIQWLIYNNDDCKTELDNLVSEFPILGLIKPTYGINVACTLSAFESIKNRITVIKKAHNLKLNRFIKAMISGYDVLKPSEEVSINLNMLIDNPTNATIVDELQNILISYYPRSIDVEGLSQSDADQYHLGMLRKNSYATVLTKSIDVIKESVFIGGNFIKSYLGVDYTRLDISAIKLPNTSLSYRYNNVRDRNGIITLQSPNMKIHGIDNSDRSTSKFAFAVGGCSDFKDFIANVVEAKVHNLYTQQNLTRSSIKNDILTASFYRPYGENMDSMDITNTVYSPQGEPLSLSKLTVGATVSFTFTLTITKERQERYIDIRIKRFIVHDIVNKENADMVDINAKTIEGCCNDNIKPVEIDPEELNIDIA